MKTIGLVVFVILFFSLVVLEDISNSEAEDFLATIEESLDWDNMTEGKFNPSDEQTPMVNVAYKIIGAMGYVTMEVTKIIPRFVHEHPAVNFNLVLKLLMVAIALPIIYPLIRIILLVIVFIKDFRQGRREKKELAKLKRRLKRKNGKR